jgi:hypothetical protein
MNTLTHRVNTYFAVLLITIFGSGAALIIMRVANSSTVFAASVKAESSLSIPPGAVR